MEEAQMELTQYDLVLYGNSKLNPDQVKELSNVLRIDEEEVEKISSLVAEHGKCIVAQGHYEKLELYKELLAKRQNIITSVIKST